MLHPLERCGDHVRPADGANPAAGARAAGAGYRRGRACRAGDGQRARLYRFVSRDPAGRRRCRAGQPPVSRGRAAAYSQRRRAATGARGPASSRAAGTDAAGGRQPGADRRAGRAACTRLTRTAAAAPRRRGAGRAGLYLGHHRAQQRSNAAPSQPPLERAGDLSGLGVERRRPAAADATALSCPRLVCRRPRHAAQRSEPGSPRALRRGRSAYGARCRRHKHVLRRADDVCAPARRRKHLPAWPAGSRALVGLAGASALRFRQRAAQPAAVRGVRDGSRAADPRALRNDRNGDEPDQPVSRRAARRYRGPAVSWASSARSGSQDAPAAARR